MAKLLWWLSVIICAMTNQLNPFHMNEVSFNLDSYYTSTLGIDNPAAIYASFFDIDNEVFQPCNPNNNTLLEKFGTPIAGDSAKLLTYFLPSSDSTFTSISAGQSYNIPEGVVIPILAPLNGIITTDPAGSCDSTFMVFKTTLGGYTIELHNMECWYCCYGHNKYNGVGYKHFNVSAEDFENKVIQQGQVLGYANSNTSIAIRNQDGEYISFTDFFGSTPYTTMLCNVNRELALSSQ